MVGLLQKGGKYCGEKTKENKHQKGINEVNKLTNIGFSPEDELKDLDKEEDNKTQEKNVTKVNTRSKWGTLKNLSKKQFENKGHLKLFISKEIKLIGKITHPDFEHLKPIHLIKKIKMQNKDIYYLTFVGEKLDPRRNIVDTLTEDFWIYNFKANQKEYTLFVPEDVTLPSGEYTIQGTLINLQDNVDIGNNSKVSSHNSIILLHSAEPRTKVIKDDKEFFEKIKSLKINNDTKLRHFFFSLNGYYYQHPPQYEDMLMALLMSSSKEYPLHFFGIGDGGCGKSNIIKGLFSKSGEDDILLMDNCTFKAVTPSFTGDRAKAGHLLQSNRFCFTDEFFTAIMKVKSEDRMDKLKEVNSLLSHEKGLRDSGNCGLKNSQMTSRFMGITNPPLRECSNMIFLLDKFKLVMPSFSRFLFFWYSDIHIKFINQQKRNRTQTPTKKISKEDFTNVYDYLYERKSDYDYKKFLKILDKLQGYIERCPEDREKKLIIKLWEMRYDHHIESLLDGIIKKRCILEMDNSFKAQKQDYEELLEMGKYLLQSWNLTLIDEKKV